MGLTCPKVGIVGGTGRMGAWLAGLLKRRGLTVLTTGLSTELTPAEMARQCDVVVISVPIADTEQVIRDIGPMIPEEGLFMDLTSIKKGPVEAMLKYSRAQVVGIHPLFGPDIIPEGDLRVAICPGRGKNGLNWITGVLQDEGLKVSLIEAEEHDRIMALIQTVNHFSTLTLAICISDSGFELKDLVNLSTRTFLERLDRIRAIIAQPAELFRSLLMENTAATEFIEKYRESMGQLIRITRDEDREAFNELFEGLKEVFSSSVKS